MRRRHNDRILYIVAWDKAGIVKIGFTDHLRRRLKTFLDAQLLLALTFPTSLVGYRFELQVHRAAVAAWPHAFSKREDAYPYIGDIAQGFRECYRTSSAEALELIASHCIVTMPVTMHRHDAASRCASRSYGRTDGLTETTGHRDGKIFRAVTRARAGRISRFAAAGGTS